MESEEKSFTDIISLVSEPEGKGSAGVVISIIGCILSAVGLVGTGIAGVTQFAMNQSSTGAEILGGVSNASFWGWTPKAKCNQPYHGNWLNPPAKTLSITSKAIEIAQMSIIEKREEYPDFPENPEDFDELTNEIVKQLEAMNDNKDTHKYATVISLAGAGMGGESGAIYDFEPEEEYYDSQDKWIMALYLKHKPGGEYWAGALFCTQHWLDLNFEPEDYEGKGQKFFEYLRDKPGDRTHETNASAHGSSDFIEIDIIYKLKLEDLEDIFDDEHMEIESTFRIDFTSGLEVLFDITQKLKSITINKN